MSMPLVFRRKTWSYVLCSVFTVLSIMVFTGTAHANGSSKAAQTISPVGTWHSTVYFLEGVMAGQQAMVDFTFTSDGKVSSETSTGITGTGTWQRTSAYSFNFQFDEKIFANGQFVGTVHVTNEAIFTDNGKGFTAYSQSTFTAPNGDVSPGDIALTIATRA